MNPGRDPQCPLDTEVQGSCVPPNPGWHLAPVELAPEGTMNVGCVIGGRERRHVWCNLSISSSFTWAGPRASGRGWVRRSQVGSQGLVADAPRARCPRRRLKGTLLF